MAIPSGGGTEVIKGLGAVYSAAATNNTLTAGTHEIITLLSVCLTATGGLNNVSLKIDSEYFMYNQQVPANATYIWNDRVVFQAGDIFHIRLHTATEVQCYVSYIVQDWS